MENVDPEFEEQLEFDGFMFMAHPPNWQINDEIQKLFKGLVCSRFQRFYLSDQRKMMTVYYMNYIGQYLEDILSSKNG